MKKLMFVLANAADDILLFLAKNAGARKVRRSQVREALQKAEKAKAVINA